jgi:glycosyltransferase involved in cell wall biosynthesis
MKTRPVVSVIIIFFDAERYLREAIESVLAQRYDDWELLLVDDGSSDGSSAVAREYTARDPQRLHYLEHPGHMNRGMSASRNLGVRHAAGEYVAFLDADDVWLPNKLQEQVPLLAEHAEAAMLYGRSLVWYGWTGRFEDARRDHVLPLGVPADTLIAPPTLVLLQLENRVQTPTTCNALIRRAAFEEVGGFEEAFRGMYEDQAFFLKLCLRRPAYVAGRCWAKYRQHRESCCAVAERSGAAHAERLPLLRWAGRYFAKEGVTDPRVWNALERALWPYRHPALHGARQAWHQMRRAARRGWRRESRRLLRALGRMLPAGTLARPNGAHDRYAARGKPASEAVDHNDIC